MKAPPDRPTPPHFGAEDNDRDELAETTEQARERVNGSPPADLFDIDAVMAWFESLPRGEQSKRLMHLYIALHDEDGAHGRRLADHVMDDRQEFLVINDELNWLRQCQELLFAHFGLELPPRPKDRPHRRE
jgi:hypothetical protein